jgi:NADPH2:quinone reductase
VLAVAGSEEKLAAARRHGADLLIDHRIEALAERVLAATEGRGADVVFDPVGGAVSSPVK